MVTRKDAYLIPRIDDTLDALGGSQWFSTLDLTWGYWKFVRVTVVFSSRDGLYEF